MIVRPASDNAQFMWPAIVNRFPTPAVTKSESQLPTWMIAVLVFMQKVQ